MSLQSALRSVALVISTHVGMTVNLATASESEQGLAASGGTATECAPTAAGTGCEEAVCPGIHGRCLPRCVRYHPATGHSVVTECECGRDGNCHVETGTMPGLRPFCTGVCRDGLACKGTWTYRADGSVDVCCDCERELNEACCDPRPWCFDIPASECAAAGGVALGPDTRCVGDFDGDGIDGSCEFDVTCMHCGGREHWVDRCTGGHDRMETGAKIGLDFDLDCYADTSMVLSGPVSVWRSEARDESAQYPHIAQTDGHRDVIDTEIKWLRLTNRRTGVVITAGEGMGLGGSLPPSLGVISEQPEDAAFAESVFDVFVEVEVDSELAYNTIPLRVESKIDCLPPETSYMHPVGCLPLFNVSGELIGNLVTANHATFPTCGNRSTGACLELNGTPYCDDLPCCERVCDGLPHCCNEDWNEACMEAACPEALIVESEPPSGTVDARQPYAHDHALPRQGIGSPSAESGNAASEPIRITLDPPVSGVRPCLVLCETAVDPVLGPNAIRSVTDLGDGVHEITLERAITAGAVTTIEYTGSGDYVEFTSHPADTNADGWGNAMDVLRTIDCCLNQVCTPPWGIYSCDVDHSSAVGSGDVLRVIDLLKGAGEYGVWDSIPAPVNDVCPMRAVTGATGGLSASGTGRQAARRTPRP